MLLQPHEPQPLQPKRNVDFPASSFLSLPLVSARLGPAQCSKNRIPNHTSHTQRHGRPQNPRRRALPPFRLLQLLVPPLHIPLRIRGIFDQVADHLGLGIEVGRELGLEVGDLEEGLFGGGEGGELGGVVGEEGGVFVGEKGELLRGEEEGGVGGGVGVGGGEGGVVRGLGFGGGDA